MFYNEFNNSNCYNREEKENHNKNKGYCTVKVIQECCYPSYIDLSEKEDKYDKHEDKHEKCCCEKDWKKEYSCNEKDNWNEKETCQCNKKEEKHDNRNERKSCGFCGCFRRW